MTAGMSLLVRVWRMSNDTDDTVGGAMITGSVVGDYPARMQPTTADQMFLQQGLETVRTFRMRLIPGTVSIRERDEIEIIQPPDNVYFGQRFRIVGGPYNDLNPRDPRNMILLDLTRSVQAHDSQ